MEGYAKLIVVTMVLAGLALGSVNGQKLCGMSKDGFDACKPSVSTKYTNPPPPSAACCEALDDADLKCLCYFKNSKWMTDYGIDFKRATSLPVQCNLAKTFDC